MWMNEYEVEDAAARYATHPVVGAAVQTLANVVEWTNSNSDGWPYWQAPSKATARLQDVIQRHAAYERSAWGVPRPEPVTVQDVTAALRTVKAFRTKHGATFTIVTPSA